MDPISTNTAALVGLIVFALLVILGAYDRSVGIMTAFGVGYGLVTFASLALVGPMLLLLLIGLGIADRAKGRA